MEKEKKIEFMNLKEFKNLDLEEIIDGRVKEKWDCYLEESPIEKVNKEIEKYSSSKLNGIYEKKEHPSVAPLFEDTGYGSFDKEIKGLGIKYVFRISYMFDRKKKNNYVCYFHYITDNQNDIFYHCKTERWKRASDIIKWEVENKKWWKNN